MRIEVGVNEFRARLREIVDQVADTGATVVVTRRSKAVAALIPIHDLPAPEPARSWPGWREYMESLPPEEHEEENR